MVTYNSEEEQIEAIKKWWKENGKSAIAGLAIGIGAIVGWNTWQSYKETQAQQASDVYQQLLEAADKKQSDSVVKLIEKIKTSYGSTPYVNFADLFLAEEKVNSGDLAGAKKILSGMVESQSNQMTKHIAMLRLIRLMVAEGESEAALKLMDKVKLAKTGAFEGQYQELKGDIFVALKRESEARIAYKRAQSLGDKSKFLQLKMDDLAVTDDKELAK